MGDMRNFQGAVAKSHLLWESESVLGQLSPSRERRGRLGAAGQHGAGSVRASLMQSRCRPQIPRVLQRQQSHPWQHWNLPSISAKPDAASNMWWARMLLLRPLPPEKSLPLMLLSPESHLCSEGEWSARISWREAVQEKARHLRVSPPVREGLVVGTALAVASGSSLFTSWWVRKQETNKKWHLKWSLQSLPHFLKAPHTLN